MPVVFGTAVSEHRWGPVALASGLTLSFLVLGLVVATAGYAIGIDAEILRKAGAILLLLVGVVLVSPPLQAKLTIGLEPLTAGARDRLGWHQRGLAGQFGVGLLLGMVWTPCVGPTLGAASVLAAQGRDLVQVSLTMLAFAVGTAIPLILVGLLSREVLMRWRGLMMATGKLGKAVLGLVLAGSGILILTNYDRTLQGVLLEILPGWLTALGEKY